jgi:hypothetical protein
MLYPHFLLVGHCILEYPFHWIVRLTFRFNKLNDRIGIVLSICHVIECWSNGLRIFEVSSDIFSDFGAHGVLWDRRQHVMI